VVGSHVIAVPVATGVKRGYKCWHAANIGYALAYLFLQLLFVI
jgi:biotin transporter BioY